jgi:integrase
MSVYKDASGRWRFRQQWTDKATGQLIKISGTPAKDKNTKLDAQAAEHKAYVEAGKAKPETIKPKEVDTFTSFFEKKYLPEWCEVENKPGTVVEKRSIYEHHLKLPLGSLKLCDITTDITQRLKASLKGRSNRYDKPISSKTADNVLAVLSHVLAYAEELGQIDKVPKIRLYNDDPPDPEYWTFSEWTALLAAATAEGSEFFISTLLAGDAGLRLGEILGLEWSDISFEKGGQLHIRRQLRKGVVGTPKSGRDRYVPLTDTLTTALRALPQVPRVGRVVRGSDGLPVVEGVLKHGVYRVCERAKLPARSWHSYRHTYATHAARFGVNSWTLQSWLGHSSVTMTERYVTLGKNHLEGVPAEVTEAGTAFSDFDERALAMLAARSRPAGLAKDLQKSQGRKSKPIETADFEVGGTGIEPATRAV